MTEAPVIKARLMRKALFTVLHDTGAFSNDLKKQGNLCIFLLRFLMLRLDEECTVVGKYDWTKWV